MKRFFKVTTLLLVASLAFAKHPKIAQDLDESDRNATVDVIVQYKQTPSDEHHAKVSGRGGRLKTKLDLIRGGNYSLPASALEALADDPDVASISPDRQVTGSMDYAVQTVGADVARTAGFDGTNIGVAVIDSGIGGHGDLNYLTYLLPSRFE